MAKVVDIAQSLSIGRTDPCAPQPLRPGAPVRPLPAGSMYLGVAQEIVPTLRDFGLDPDPIIRAAGLDPNLFEDEDNVIPFAAMGRLCARSVARTNCPHFGLLVGRRATIRSLGIVGRLMLHSETVGDALRSLVSNPSAQNRGAVAALAVTGDTAVFSYAVYQPETESADQITDGALACTVNAMRTLLGADWAPVEVLLPRASPADAEPYRRHFRAPVRFNQEIGALVLPVSCLQRRIAGADPFLCCAVPEDRPVPSFVTGERWDFRGTWEDAISPPGLYLTAAELHGCLNSFYIFRIARQLESRRMFEDPKRHEVCGDPA